MADRIQFELVTPERRVLAEEVNELTMPGVEGYLGVRPGHAPLLTQLQVGEVTYRKDGKDHVLAISGGFAEVLRQRVSVLAETAEKADEIDTSRAEEAKDRAEKRLKSPDDDTNVERAQVALARAINRLTISRRGH